MKIAAGKMEMPRAIWRHDMNDDIAIAKNPPKFAAIGVSANNVPRIDFSLKKSTIDW